MGNTSPQPTSDTTKQQPQHTSVQSSPVDTSAVVYQPSSAEKKKSMVMYLLFGIMMMAGKEEMNSFEYFHMKQATGRRIIFIIMLIVSLVLLFVPLIRWLVIIPMIVMLGLWGYFVKQSRDGHYQRQKDSSPISVFAGIGVWLLNLFDFSPVITDTQSSVTQAMGADGTQEVGGQNVSSPVQEEPPTSSGGTAN